MLDYDWKTENMRKAQELGNMIMHTVQFPSPTKTFWKEFREWAKDESRGNLSLLRGVYDEVCETGELPWDKNRPPLMYKGVKVEMLKPYEAHCALEEIARGENFVSMRVVNRLREIAYETPRDLEDE